MKKFIIALGLVLIILLFWYLFIKPQDYQVSFKVKTLPGTVYETVKAWNKTLDDSEAVKYNSLTDFEQTITVNDSVHTYHWEIESVHDSLSEVTVHISDVDHSLSNKIAVPFSDTDFEKGSRKRLLDFNQYLKDHLEIIRVKILGEDDLFSSFCACINVTTPQAQKAVGMMDNYSFLSSMLAENQVQLNGLPFLQVQDWDLEKDLLNYNFCYPIIRSERLPKHPDIQYKRIFSQRVLKAEYNGNYITSDRAWYALMYHAEKNGIEVERNPIEVFYNNPNMGGDELKWKTEVFMPIKDSE